MINNKTNDFFHSLANDGKAITEYRRYHKKLSKLPAYRIEILLQLAILKQKFLNK